MLCIGCLRVWPGGAIRRQCHFQDQFQKFVGHYFYYSESVFFPGLFLAVIAITAVIGNVNSIPMNISSGMLLQLDAFFLRYLTISSLSVFSMQSVNIKF